MNDKVEALVSKFFNKFEKGLSLDDLKDNLDMEDLESELWSDEPISVDEYGEPVYDLDWETRYEKLR